MSKGIKIALPGYNAFTDPDPDHFSLFVDQEVDYILIKEKLRDTVSINNSTTQNIAHGLGYVPFCLVFVESSSGVWRKLFSSPVDGNGYWYEINSTNLVIENQSGGTKTFSYYIFYDEVNV